MFDHMPIPYQGKSEEPVHPYTNAQPGYPQYPAAGPAAGAIAAIKLDRPLAPEDAERLAAQTEPPCGCTDNIDGAGIPAKLVFAGHAFIVQPEDKENLPEVTFGFSGVEDVRTAIEDLKAYIEKNHIDITNKDSFAFFQEVELLGEDSPLVVESKQSGVPISMSMLEMEMFNVKRRDITSFKNFLKAPELAGKAITAKGGLDKNKKKYLVPFIHEISRDPLFSHPQYDLTYNMLDKAKGVKPKKNAPRFVAPDGQAFKGFV